MALKSIFVVFVLSTVIFATDYIQISGETPYYAQKTEIIEAEKIIEETAQVEIIEFETIATTQNTFDFENRRIDNHRRIVVSAVMMMLFAGLAMASVSSINPE